jgi:hypothetical protein
VPDKSITDGIDRRSTRRTWIRMLIVIVVLLALLAGTFGEIQPFFRPAPAVPWHPDLLYSR